MDYFLLDEKSGELRTAKPLDREALPDSIGLITLTVRVSRIFIKYFLIFGLMGRKSNNCIQKINTE